MYKFPVYWTEKQKVNFLQRVVLINSYLYYEEDNPKISDKQFDEFAKQLVSLQKNMSKQELRKTQYGYCFYDFDGTTGFDLFSRLKEKDKQFIQEISRMLVGGNK